MKKVIPVVTGVIVIMILLSIVYQTACFNSSSHDAEVPYERTPGTSVTVCSDVDSNGARRSVECYPTEIYYGDTVYFSEYVENTTEMELRRYLMDNLPSWYWRRVEVSSPAIEGKKYRWTCEKPLKEGFINPVVSFYIKPGAKYCVSRYEAEFCPLQDYEDPFWKELREKMKPEGVRCTLTIMTVHDEKTGQKKVVTQDILVKPRPENEMALLDKWYRNTPKKCFPTSGPTASIFHDARINDKGRSNIRFSRYDWKSYDPWLFIRIGNRKPSVPNNPRTLSDWRELEVSLAPSTMRDEVRLTRLRLEYFAAKTGEEAEKAKKVYADWLNSLPDPQRNVMRAYSHWSMPPLIDLLLKRETKRNYKFADRYAELEKERYIDLKESLNPISRSMKDITFSRAVVIGVDGGGTYFRDANTPNFDRIFKTGAISYDVETSNPTKDAACWASILHGVRPMFHQRSDSVVESTPYPNDDRYPSIFRMIRKDRPDAQLASFCAWEPINIGIIEDDLNVVKGTGKTDADVAEQACEYLKTNDPALLFVQFNECDQVGHDKGFGSKEQLAQISATDGLIQRIYESYESRGLLDSTLFIVVTDHGGIGTEHGGSSPEESRVMFAAAGSEVETGTIGDMSVYDIPFVIYSALDRSSWTPNSCWKLGNDVYWEGRVPPRLFKGVLAHERVETHAKFYKHEFRHGYGKGPELIVLPTSESAEKPTVPYPLADERVRFFLPFEGGIDDCMGNVETSAHNVIDNVDGYYGQGGAFGGGWVSLENVPLNKDSFSVGFWMKANYVEGEPCIISCKGGEGLAGFTLSLSPPDVRFCVECDGKRRSAKFPLPKDYNDGWVYVVLVVDRQENVVRLSYDFQAFKTVALGSEFADVDFGAQATINIGNDGTGENAARLNAVVDEFGLINGVVSAENLKTLESFYQKSAPSWTKDLPKYVW